MKTKGFTLVELTVVAALTGILGSLIIPAYLGFGHTRTGFVATYTSIQNGEQITNGPAGTHWNGEGSTVWNGDAGTWWK